MAEQLLLDVLEELQEGGSKTPETGENPWAAVDLALRLEMINHPLGIS